VGRHDCRAGGILTTRAKRPGPELRTVRPNLAFSAMGGLSENLFKEFVIGEQMAWSVADSSVDPEPRLILGLDQICNDAQIPSFGLQGTIAHECDELESDCFRHRVC
jgi:hypothetical protein